MELTKAALSRIEGSGRIMNLIAAEMDCTESTVRRWIAKNDTMLTTASVMKIIRQETGLKINEILKEENIQKS